MIKGDERTCCAHETQAHLINYETFCFCVWKFHKSFIKVFQTYPLNRRKAHTSNDIRFFDVGGGEAEFWTKAEP